MRKLFIIFMTLCLIMLSSCATNTTQVTTDQNIESITESETTVTETDENTHTETTVATSSEVTTEKTSAVPTTVTNNEITKSTTTETAAKPTTAEKNETTGQTNAVRKAKDYLSIMAFSRGGLIEQLEFEKFTHEQAVYGADNCGADWE